ncbi:hypothetical protein [Pediococcus pentosaceus]|uniref:hypothetical protein n=1 Tax=Pediococcus pentosaceus TaxID=1255 RepID=UPI000C07E4F0|nr:hypothetical protein [Pediococcus pentosaceus]
MENAIYPVESIDSAMEISEIQTMCSFEDSPTINKENLIHLLKGKPLVDLNDGEFVHWLQLDDDAIRFVKEYVLINNH